MTTTYRLFRWSVRQFAKIYGKWSVIHPERVPSTGAVILCANHVSFLDPPLVGAGIKRECAFMARHTLWKGGLMKWALPRLNAFPVHRDTADRNALRVSIDWLKRGYVLVMFPEGTRGPGGQLRPAEPGVALIVKQSAAPVVPVAVIGAEDVLPMGASKPKKGKITIVYGHPIFFTPDSSRSEITTTIMKAIAALLTEYGVPVKAAEELEEADSSPAVTS